MIYNLPLRENFYETITDYAKSKHKQDQETNRDYYNIIIIVPNNHIAYCLKKAFGITCILPQIYTTDNIFEKYAMFDSKRLGYINFQDKSILEIYELLAKEKQFFSIEAAKQFFHALMNAKEIEHEYFSFIKQQFGFTGRQGQTVNKIESYREFQKEAIEALFQGRLNPENSLSTITIIMAAFNLDESSIINYLFEKCLTYKQTIFICGFNFNNPHKFSEGESLAEKLDYRHFFYELNCFLNKVTKEKQAFIEKSWKSSDSDASSAYNSISGFLFFNYASAFSPSELIYGEKIKIIKCPNNYYLLAATEECLKANYKDVALVGNDSLLLGKLAHRLAAYNNITLCYKKPLKEHPDFLFLASLLELVIQPNRNKNLLNVLKNPYIYEAGANFWGAPSNVSIDQELINKNIIDEIELNAIRKLRLSNGWQGMKELLTDEAALFLTSLEMLLVPLVEYAKEQKNNGINGNNEISYSYNFGLELLKCMEHLTKKPLQETRRILNFLLKNSKLLPIDLVEYQSVLNFYVNKEYYEEEAKFENKIKVYAPEEALLLAEKNIVFLNACEKDFGINNKITNYNLYHLLSGQKNIYIFYSQQEAAARIFLKLQNFIGPAIDYNNNINNNISFANEANYLKNQPQQNLAYSLSREKLKIQPSFLPNILTATMLEYLLNEPYKFYLKYILKIKELEPIDKKPSYKEFGILLHEIFQGCNYKCFPDKEISHEELMVSFDLQAKKYYPNFAYVKTLWLAKFNRIAEHFIDWHNSRRNNIQELETAVEYEFPIHELKIRVKLDRIEYSKDGSASIIDFKTGVLPTFKDIENFVKPQLLIQSLALKKIKNINISELMYCKPEIERILEKGIDYNAIASLTMAMEHKLSALIKDYQAGEIDFSEKI